MGLVVVKSNAGTSEDVLVRDLGESVPKAGGSVSYAAYEDIRVLQDSRDLRPLLVDNAFGLNSSTLILNNGVEDIPQAYATNFLDTADIPSTNLYSIPRGPGSSSRYTLTRFADTTGGLLEGAGVRWYPPGAIDPVPGGDIPAPNDGDLYYNTALKMPMFFDGARSKWLSVEECNVQWSRSGNTAPGSYYKIDGDLTFSATNGFPTDHNGTIISMAYTRDDVDPTTFEIHADGVLISGAVLASAAMKGLSTGIDADFSSGVILAVYNALAGNIVSNAAGRARLRWRA